MDDTYTAILDRIVDGETAVLVLEDDGEVVAERTLEVCELPAEGRHEGAVFEVLIGGGGEVLESEYQEGVERERREQLQDRFDRLSRRLSDEE